MRLLPAHLREAKQMARNLCDSFEHLGIPRDWKDPQSAPPTLQQSQELLAKAMGYAGWRELAHVMQLPHPPVYLDTLPPHQGGAVFEQLVTRLSEECGLHYPHGTIANALQISGVGYSPRTRRTLSDDTTPWGVIMDEDEPIAEGIRSVSTGSHGGWLLSEERQARVPEHLRNPQAAYEEDGEFYLVAIAFPDEAPAFGVSLRAALEYVQVICHSSEADTDLDNLSTRLVSQPSDGGADLRNIPSGRTPKPPLSEIEHRVVQYLADCIRSNRLPARFPREISERPTDPLLLARAEHYTLQEWVECLASVPTTDGRWPTRRGPWFDHWDWRCRERQRSEAYAKRFGWDLLKSDT